MEIERKWSLGRLPNQCYIPSKVELIDQYYISFNPEIRLRKYQVLDNEAEPTESPYYTLTIKSTGCMPINGVLKRSEVEVNISESQYNELVEYYCMNHAPIVKTDFHYEYAGFDIRISAMNNNRFYAEVEFPEEDIADNFVFPFYDISLGEVTNDPFYQMKNIYQFINKI